LNREVNVHSIYVKLEAEQEDQYKSYSRILHDTAIAVARHFGLRITDNEARKFAESIQYWAPFDDTVRSLRVLGERGYKRVILSNVDRDLLQGTIAENDLEVDGYITAEDVGSYKPALAHWNRFFSEYKVSKSETLHVAQSVFHDITPSSKIGLANAWINRYHEQRPPGISPTWVFPDLAGLLEVLG
jgi:2-haloalkanoic acid dehalogenase type II